MIAHWIVLTGSQPRSTALLTLVHTRTLKMTDDVLGVRYSPNGKLLAVALLDSTMLRMTLPSSVEVDSVVFGLPRVGNQQFADMIDSIVRVPPLFFSAMLTSAV